jgi:phosphosulfolactate phosphohydrolase-like enzyme
VQRLVLPSPNGSTLSFQLAKTVPAVIGASLRNRHAAAVSMAMAKSPLMARCRSPLVAR